MHWWWSFFSPLGAGGVVSTASSQLWICARLLTSPVGDRIGFFFHGNNGILPEAWEWGVLLFPQAALRHFLHRTEGSQEAKKQGYLVTKSCYLFMPILESVKFLALQACSKCGPSIFVTDAERLLEDNFKFLQLELSTWTATKKVKAQTLTALCDLQVAEMHTRHVSPHPHSRGH